MYTVHVKGHCIAEKVFTTQTSNLELSESSLSLEVGVYSSYKFQFQLPQIFLSSTTRDQGSSPPGGGGFSRQFRIGVCRQGSQTLALFQGRKSRFDTLFKAQNHKNGALI